MHRWRPIFEAFKGGPEVAFSQGYTCGGHPAGAVAGLVNIEIIEREGLVERSAAMGRYLLDRLAVLKEHPTVGDVRGLGLACSVDLVQDKITKVPMAAVPGAEKLVKERMAELGVMARVGSGVYLLPPLTVTEDDLDEIVEATDQGVSHMERELGLA